MKLLLFTEKTKRQAAVKLRDKNARRVFAKLLQNESKSYVAPFTSYESNLSKSECCRLKKVFRKGVIELLSTTCNSFICLRFVVEKTRKVALNSFAATLYKIFRVFFIAFTTNSQVIKRFLKSFFELRVVSIKLSYNFDGNMRVCIS